MACEDGYIAQERFSKAVADRIAAEENLMTGKDNSTNVGMHLPQLKIDGLNRYITNSNTSSTVPIALQTHLTRYPCVVATIADQTKRPDEGLYLFAYRVATKPVREP